VLFKFFSIRSNYKHRLGSIVGALGLALIGIFLGFCITTSLLDLPFFFPAPGDFFIGAYGILAFMIPAYFIAASLILIDPAYRPDRIFILSAAVFPFLTLAVGLAVFRNYAGYEERFRFMALLGEAGFSFGILLFTFLEIAAIRALAIRLFPLTPKSPPRETAGKDGDSAAAGSRNARVLLAPPGSKTRSSSPRGGRKRTESGEPPKEAAKPSTWYDGALVSSRPAKGSANQKEPASLIETQRIRPAAGEPEAAGGVEKFHQEPGRGENPAGGPGPSRKDVRKQAEIEVSLKDDFPDIDAFLGGDAYDFLDIDGLPDAKQRETGGVPPEKDEEPDDEDFDFSEDDEESGEDEDQEDDPASFRIPAPVDAALPAAGSSGSGGTSASARARTSGRDGGAGKTAKPKTYRVPVDGILNQYMDGQYWIIDQPTRDAAHILQKTLEEFGIQAEVTGIRKGPVITMFEILPAPGVKLSKIVNLQDNIALRLAASSVRIVAPIPGKHAVGIEVPNRKRNIVSFREIIEGELRNDGAWEGKKDGRRLEIPVVLGKDIAGEAQTVDLVQTPHLLIAGATGSGKSVCVNTMILSILYQRAPAECRLILIDPKIVELKLYNDIPHLLTPVITEPKRAFQALQYCLFEMERRYACLDSMGVRDIKNYNRRIRERNIAAEHIPYIVVVIDEFADLMVTTGKELESTVARLAAMSRAVGIHLVLATQRPSIDVITGLIKANIPSRIAFMVASKMDSRIIIDMVGAEKLLGKGDMLYAGVVDPFPIRMQGAFVSEEEVERVVEYVKTLGQPDYIDDEIFFEDEEDEAPADFAEGEDPLYDKALEIVVQQGKASASYIQRRLKIGYNRAARLVEEMEIRGVVGPAQGSKPRELLRGI
jgi:S-DNA-T family DNA segregation ATPase FtsK/SpoIIIE